MLFWLVIMMTAIAQSSLRPLSRDRRGVGLLLGNLDAGTWHTCTIAHIPKVQGHVFLGFSIRIDICCS